MADSSRRTRLSVVAGRFRQQIANLQSSIFNLKSAARSSRLVAHLDGDGSWCLAYRRSATKKTATDRIVSDTSRPHPFPTLNPASSRLSHSTSPRSNLAIVQTHLDQPFRLLVTMHMTIPRLEGRGKWKVHNDGILQRDRAASRALYL